jgi:putative ABC transport system permease protein
MLGMVIGVGAVVLMMAIGQGAQYTVQADHRVDGVEHVHRALRLHHHRRRAQRRRPAPTLTVADADAIAELPTA